MRFKNDIFFVRFSVIMYKEIIWLYRDHEFQVTALCLSFYLLEFLDFERRY